MSKQVAGVEQDRASLKKELASVRLEVEARAEGAMAREATLRLRACWASSRVTCPSDAAPWRSVVAGAVGGVLRGTSEGAAS